MALLPLRRVVALLLLLGHQGDSPAHPAPTGFSSHSVFYFITSFSEPGQQVPQFSYVEHVDDQEFVSYDASTKRYLPKFPWVRKVNDDPHYWLWNSWYAQDYEQSFQDILETLAEDYNQSGGIHTLQLTYGCEMRKDGSKGGYWKYAYDGKDFISFDKETLTWTAANVSAQNFKKKWDADSLDNQHKKFYLEETCIVWLQRYLTYGKEMLLRTEKPEVNVTRKTDHDGMETLTCHVWGFYPKEIDIDWTRDGEVWHQDVFHGLVSPNSDGTYYTQRNITVDPKERERYKCHVEHDALQRPMDVAWEEPASKLWLIIGCVVGVLFLIAALAGIAVYFKKWKRDFIIISRCQDGHNAASEKHQEVFKNVSVHEKDSHISEERASLCPSDSMETESDEGFGSILEGLGISSSSGSMETVHEKDSHNSEERASLGISSRSGSMETALGISSSSGSMETALHPSGSSSNIEIVHEEGSHNSEKSTL
ncbi:major histocompatibility complex class I-related gene protein-like isoform X5 [Anolis sagrei]|uniref:major histocompatibility complex class I-related gene protein-like isoform X5 n=1 Tax=Anolis sagrei TaxID=38937 RepID=UPI0035220858